MKELHIWLTDSYYTYDHKKLYTTLTESLTALNNNEMIIHTTQTHCCSTVWLVKGYSIILHMIDGKEVTLNLGYNPKIKENIRLTHNIEKMMLSNVFGYATLNIY